MNYLFTSESVSEGHPDKVADQISDAILDEFLSQDPESKVACETFCSTGLVVIGGEVRSDEAYVDVQKVVRGVINRIGYNKAEYMFDGNSCGVLSEIHEQSQDINRGVVRENPEDQGAGDQGMMFGYACKDTEDYMPLPLYLSQIALQVLADIRHNTPELMPYLRPDSKSQFTIEYDESHHPVRVHTIVISTQHDDFVAEGLGNITYSEAVRQFGQDKVDQAMHDKIEADVRNILLPKLKTALNPHSSPVQGRFHPARQSDRQVRDRWPCGRHRPHRPEDHRGHLRWKGRARRRSVLRQGSHQGGPLRGIRGKAHSKEYGRRRCR